MKPTSAEWVSRAYLLGRVALNSLQPHLYGSVSLPIRSSTNEKQPATTGLLDESEAAGCLRQRVGTLRAWRCEGKGPAFLKLGRSVFYDPSDVEKFIAEQKVDLRKGSARNDQKERRALALPDPLPGKRVSKKHRLGGYVTQRQRREDDRSGGPKAVEERRLP